ncbi:Serpentine Receptor, class AB (Class A-like) [Caenorhabditis elegans]|uniref:Serpentine Receptor, class AB (Class A-like) n=1 Tax=Caenorhabditis elegans TaxID=6239 RepID=O16412_CAEEL|nr:Serpentine Receptor, class AB (Class A-like) [Caenorhabditis elegans]CCD66856.1 Serpentine Receptor, class AB (Class A-like) [Caenorhabditis elegans]|eukprot:NP_503875.1 Serpentine Receptor, class AB (class A-like) [Caenorhabditis elegans]
MSSYQEHCKMMEIISTSRSVQLTLIFQLLCSLIALPVVVIASHWLSKSRNAKLFHINVIIIFQIHLFGFFIHFFSRIILHGLDLYNYAVFDYCDMPASTIRCFIFRTQYVFGIRLVSATTVPFIIERYIATVRSTSYEHSGCTFGVLMAILQLSIGFFSTAFTFSSFSFTDPSMNYCIAFKIGIFGSAEVINLVGVASQIIGRVLFEYMFRKNEKLRAKLLMSTLSNRYSLEQNLKSMRTLKVFANLQSIFLTLQMTIFIIIFYLGLAIEKTTYIALIELNAGYPIYAVVSILILFRREQLNKVTLDKSLEAHIYADHSTYFENFNKALK